MFPIPLAREIIMGRIQGERVRQACSPDRTRLTCVGK